MSVNTEFLSVSGTSAMLADVQKPIVSVSGVRGIVEESFTDDLVRAWAEAFASSLRAKRSNLHDKIASSPAAPRNDLSIVLGRDTRPSGTQTIEIAAQALQAQGVQPIVVGIAPTPTIQLAVTHHRAAGAMIVTASHNPQEWNGVKFLGSDGVFLTAEEMKELEQRVIASEGSERSNPRALGDIEIALASPRNDGQAVSRHVENILSLPIDIEKIRGRKFRVVVDPVNGAGAVAVPQLLQQFGCDVIVINGEPNGQFAHTPEPTPANLTELGKRVAAERADLGIAVDPDADRLVLVDETGTVISEEYTVTLAALSALEGTRGREDKRTSTVVVNLSTTRMVDDVAKQFGATVFRTPVGERNVVEGMRQHHALIGGEGSGGVIFPQSHEGRDSLVGIALVLDLLARRESSLTSLLATLPRYVMSKEKFPREGTLDAERFAALQKAFPQAQLNTLDGIRIDTPDGWVHLRSSNTEPVIRLISEAPTPENLTHLSDRVRTILSIS